MGLFPIIEADAVVQVSDKFRIYANQSFISGSAATISNVEIEPDSGAGYTSVYNLGDKEKWILDWAYTSGGDKTISVRLTDSLANQVTMSMVITCLTSAQDRLFATDADLKALEDDVLLYLPKGRSSFKYMHRKVQNEILDWIKDIGLRRRDGTEYDKDDIIDISEVKKLSIEWALYLIFEDLVKRPDDVFDRKSKLYQDRKNEAMRKARLKLDYDQSGNLDKSEFYNLQSSRMSRG